MTGEVTLQGRVLPIGGLKQKVLAAHAAGLTEVIVPERNEPDLEDVPADVREIGTFSVMYLLNFSLNNISMMALILSIGFVVDDAIVMLENIVRHIENGREAHARRRSTDRKEIGFTIVSMTLSLAAVFIPILFMGGHSRPPVPRVRGHHLRRHPDLGRGFDQPDTDAVQPLPAREASRSRTGFCTA